MYNLSYPSPPGFFLYSSSGIPYPAFVCQLFNLFNICNGCGMPTEDAYSSGHLVLSLLGLAFVLLVETSDTLYWLDIIPVCDIIPGLDIITESDILPNIGFHRASATGVACQQGTLTPPDTWSCPTLGLACVLMSRPISPELVLTFEFRTPLGASLLLLLSPRLDFVFPTCIQHTPPPPLH